jgi:cbb3-type cytochrome oxidase cytochrome c subunit
MMRSKGLRYFAGVVGALLIATVFTATAQTAAPLDISALAGKQIYALKKCGDCHNQGAKEFTPIKAAPDSAKLSAHVEALKSANVLRQDTSPRRQKRTMAEEVVAMVAYLKQREKADAAPANMVTAGFVMVRETCRTCHLINGVGNKDGAGPDLKGVGSRHDKKWLIDHFIDPTAFVKDSMMPSKKDLPKEELEAMADYLLALK